jgi:hypothetical protein
VQPLSFSARFAFAFSAFFRVLVDGAFAARALAAQTPVAPGADVAPPAASLTDAAPDVAPEREQDLRKQGALLVLSLLQREGRMIDFLMQDVNSFSDAEIGAAARLVHEGARKAIRSHAVVEPVRSEQEGARVELAAADASVKLIGSVSGSGPYKGALRHRGWRLASLSLPTPTADFDAAIISAAEIEL